MISNAMNEILIHNKFTFFNYCFQIELLENSGVWINVAHLELFKDRARDARDLTRKLLTELVTLPVLAKSCTLGKSTSRPAIATPVFNTVRSELNKFLN